MKAQGLSKGDRKEKYNMEKPSMPEMAKLNCSSVKNNFSSHILYQKQNKTKLNETQTLSLMLLKLPETK